MKNLLDSLHEVLLMGPGPSCIPEAVYQALSRPTIGHLDPLFIEIMDEIKQLLRQVMQTGNRLTIPISGTGSAGASLPDTKLEPRGISFDRNPLPSSRK